MKDTNNDPKKEKQPKKGFIDYFDDDSELYETDDANKNSSENDINTASNVSKPSTDDPKTNADTLNNSNDVPEPSASSEQQSTVSSKTSQPQNNKSNYKYDYQEVQDDYYDDEDEYDDEEYDNSSVLIRIIIILSSLALCAIVIYFINTDSGPVGFFKNYVASLFQSDADLDANHTNPVFDPVSENSMTMPFENAADSKYSKYRNGILVAKSNYIGFLTAESGIVWEKNTVVVNPILCAEGNYILLADKGSRKLCLYNRDKLLYSIETKDNIISARVSSNGDAIIIEEKDFYKGAVTVYNSNGEEIFAWNSGTDTILAADISDSSRRVAISLINTTDQISSNIIMFNIKETEHYASFQLADSIVFELNFLGETLHATSDNRIVGLSTRARLLWDITYDSQTLVHTALDGKGNRIVLLDDNNAAIIDYYSSSGRKRFTQNAADLPDFVDINGTNIVYNAGRSVICGRISSDSLRQFTASMDIHNLVLGDDGTVLIVYGNSLEFIKI